MSDRIKGSALTMGGAACWGVSGCMGQYLFTREGMDSTWLVPIRLFLAGLILCGFFFIKDRKTLFDPWNVRKNPRNAIDLLVYGLAGVFLITTHGSLTGLAVSPAALVSGIVSACCVAIYTMWPKKLQEQYPTPMLQGWAFLMGGIMFSLIFRPWQIDYVPTAMGVFGIFIVVVLGNVLAFSLYMSGVPLIGPQKASLYSFAEPVTAAIISTLVLGSPFTLWDALGFGCIFLMLVLLSLPTKQKN